MKITTLVSVLSLLAQESASFRVAVDAEFTTPFGNDATETPIVEMEPTVTPLNYTIRLRPVLDSGYEGLQQGTAQITLVARVKALQASNVINLEHKNLRVNHDAVKVTRVSSGLSVPILEQIDKPKPVIRTPYDDHPPLEPNWQYGITLNETFSVGEELEVSIPYEVDLTRPPFSVLIQSTFGTSNYTEAKTGEDKAFAVTTLEKYEALKVLPLFVGAVWNDTKSRFKISVGRVEGKYNSVSNMELERTEPDSEHKGWVWDVYQETPPLSHFQIFALVSPLANYTYLDPQSNVSITVWTTQSYLEGNQSKVAEVASIAAQFLQYYTSILGAPYPSKKLDIVNLPSGTAQQTDYFGVILLSDLDTSKDDLIKNIGTEVAKQWFGIVTTVKCSQCGYETQLQEQLYTYAKSLGISEVLPQTSVEELFELGNQGLGDTSSRTRLKMMEEMFGKEVMIKTLANFVKTSMWTVAPQEALYGAMDEAIKFENATSLLPLPGIKMEEVLPDWLAYRPELIVRVKMVEEKTVEFSQEGYDSWRPNDTEVAATKYWTPVVIKKCGGSVEKLWIPKTSAKVSYNLDTSDGKCFLINPNGLAPYRVLYEDPKAFQAISQKLVQNTTSISEGGRIKLLRDELTLAESGHIPIENALELTRYLDKETSGAVWGVVIDKLVKPLDDNLKEDEKGREAFRKYFVPKLQAWAEKLGRSGVINSYSFQGLCLSMRVPACVEHARERIAEWKMNPTRPISTLYGAVPVSEWFCAALADSNDNEATWDFLLDRFLTANDSLERYYLIEGLSCSTNATQVTSLLDQSSGLQEGTQNDIYESFSRSREIGTRKSLYEFAKKNLLSGKLSPERFSSIIIRLNFPPRLEPNMAKDLREFINANKGLLKDQVKALEDYASTGFNSCSQNCDWWNKTGEKAYNWFTKKGSQ